MIPISEKIVYNFKVVAINEQAGIKCIVYTWLFPSTKLFHPAWGRKIIQPQAFLGFDCLAFLGHSILLLFNHISIWTFPAQKSLPGWFSCPCFSISPCPRSQTISDCIPCIEESKNLKFSCFNRGSNTHLYWKTIGYWIQMSWIQQTKILAMKNQLKTTGVAKYSSTPSFWGKIRTWESGFG